MQLYTHSNECCSLVTKIPLGCQFHTPHPKMRGTHNFTPHTWSQDIIVKLPFFQTGLFTLGYYPALTLLVSWEDIRVILTGPIWKLTPESEVIVTKFRGEQCPHLYHASDATLRGNSTFPFESFCIWFNLRRKQSAETKHPLCSLLFALCTWDKRMDCQLL